MLITPNNSQIHSAVIQTNQQSLNVITLQNPPITPIVLNYILTIFLSNKTVETL